MWPDVGRREALGASRSQHQTLEKARANTMTMKERLKIHLEMERKNKERIRDHIARQKKTA